MNIEERKQMLMDVLFKRYGSLRLGRESTGKVLGISSSSLDRLKAKGLGPKWSKDGQFINGKVTYAIDDIVDYIIEQNIYKGA